MKEDNINLGKVQKAPENFLDQAGIKKVFAEGKEGRRGFIRSAFAAAAAGVAAMPAAAGVAAGGTLLLQRDRTVEAWRLRALILNALQQHFGCKIRGQTRGAPDAAKPARF